MLETIKISARDQLHSLTDEGHNCTLMLLSNLREPDWIPITCQEELLHFSICKAKKKTILTYKISSSIAKYICKSTNILVNEKCYILKWKHFWNTKVNFCSKFHGRGISRNEFSSLYHIFDAVSVIDAFPNIVLQYDHKVHIIEITKFFNKPNFNYIINQNSTRGGYAICNIERSKIKIGINIFHCKKGGYILQNLVCDENRDCPNDSSDEDFCICNKGNENSSKAILCKVLKINQSVTHCTPNYYVGLKGSCDKYDSGDKEILQNFLCNTVEQLITTSSPDVQNCGVKPQNTSLPLLSSQANHIFPCRPYEIPCMDSNACFDFKDICLYKLDKENQMIPCKMGDHLENCAQFECNIFFKCPEYYCIFWSYVCDGKWDCPYGDDEINSGLCTGENLCHNMYKCSNVFKCINLDSVCNGKSDCPYNDDEMLCDFKLIQCPVSCRCLMYAITCFRINFKIFQTNLLALFLKVTISESLIDPLNIFEQKLQDLYFIYLPKNDIKTICPLLFLNKVLLLDLQFNSLLQIKEKCFSACIFLRCLNLNNNNITYLNIYSFYDLHDLRFLNLSGNSFFVLPSKCFYALLSLKVLHFGKIQFKEIYVGAFIYSNVKIIMTLDYKLSCISPHDTYSTSHPPWYISCSDILPGRLIKAIYITISLSTIFLNFLSILLQVKKKQGNEIFKTYVIGLNLSDSLCGVYLFNMWLSDQIVQSMHFVNEELWKSHLLCFVGHGLILWFTISSQISLISLSAARFLAIIYPLKTRIKSQKKAVYQISFSQLFTMCFSVLLTLVLLFTEKHLPTSLCLPFIDPSGLSFFSKVISITNVISQSIISGIIFSMHIFLIIHVNKTVGSMQIQQSLNNSNRVILPQLILTSASNILCWFPVNILYISAMYLSVYPVDLVIWTTVGIMPLNSIINPCIFISMKLKRF